MQPKIICLAITGASGFPYAMRLLHCLLQGGHKVYLLVSDAAREVARLEAGLQLPQESDALKSFLLQHIGLEQAALQVFSRTDWLSPVASGSSHVDAMVVCPCSTGTLSAIANGNSNNLIERAATVALKEHRRLILLPREMPVSAIQLEQMHKLALMGVRILPASPGFYHQPQSVGDMVDFVVARILQQLELPQQLVAPWGESDFSENA